MEIIVIVVVCVGVTLAINKTVATIIIHNVVIKIRICVIAIAKLINTPAISVGVYIFLSKVHFMCTDKITNLKYNELR